VKQVAGTNCHADGRATRSAARATTRRHVRGMAISVSSRIANRPSLSSVGCVVWVPPPRAEKVPRENDAPTYRAHSHTRIHAPFSEIKKKAHVSRRATSARITSIKKVKHTIAASRARPPTFVPRSRTRHSSPCQALSLALSSSLFRSFASSLFLLLFGLSRTYSLVSLAFLSLSASYCYYCDGR